MKKRTLCLLSMALMLTIALTSCAGDPAEGLPEASPEETVPLSVPAALEADAQALTLYREYLTGERAAQEVLIQDSESGREIHFTPTTFQPPDLYEADAYNDGMLWRVEQFTLSDLDGDGVRELLLYTSNSGAGAYEILTCCDGELYVNTRWPRGFRDLRTAPSPAPAEPAQSISHAPVFQAA